MSERRPARKAPWATRSRIRDTRTGKAGLSRALWGLVGLAALLFAMSMLSGRLRSSRSAEESLSPVQEESEQLGAPGIGEEAVGEERAGASPGDAVPDYAGDAASLESAVNGEGGGAPGDKTAATDDGETAGEGSVGEEGSAPGDAASPGHTAGGEGAYPSLQGGGDAVPDLGGSLIKVVLSLGVVFLLVLATRAFLKRVRAREGRENGDTYLKVLGYTRLGNGTGVHEVQVGERVWFIGEGERELRLLGEFDISELEISRLAKEGHDEGGFARELEGNLTTGAGEWRGTVPRGWLNALRWKTAR